MKCFYHYEKDSKESCCACSHPLCEDCIIDVNGKSYCRECIQKAQQEVRPQIEQKAVTPQPLKKSSALATWLSILPGLGFIYLGLYLKGITIFAIWAGIMTFFNDHHEFSGLLSFGFWVFQLVYTNQEAKKLNRLRSGTPEMQKEKKEEGSLVWGIVVVIIGFLFLINSFGLDISWMINFWPLIVIGLGAQMIRNSFKKEAAS